MFSILGDLLGDALVVAFCPALSSVAILVFIIYSLILHRIIVSNELINKILEYQSEASCLRGLHYFI